MRGVTWELATKKLQSAIKLLRHMLFLANEPAKKAEINILKARDTTGPGF